MRVALQAQVHRPDGTLATLEGPRPGAARPPADRWVPLIPLPVATPPASEPPGVSFASQVILPDGTPAPLRAAPAPPEPFPAVIYRPPPEAAPAPPEPRWRVVSAPLEAEVAPLTIGVGYYATSVGVIGGGGTTLTATPADLTSAAVVDITDFTIITLDAGSIL